MKQTVTLSLIPTMAQIEAGAGFPTIQLIKALREATGMGLRESKDIIDTLKAKGTVTFDYTGAAPCPLPFEEYNFIRVECAGLRRDVQTALTEFAKRGIDVKEYTLAKTLIGFLEAL